MVDRCPGVTTALETLALRLREARQARGLSLPAFAEQIFLKPEALEALEAGDQGRLPSGLHLIEQVRWVATNLELDVEPLLELVREQESAPTDPEPAPVGTATPVVAAKRPAGFRAAPLVAAIAVALGGGALLLARSQRQGSAPAAAPATPARTSAQTVANPVLMLSTKEPSWLEIRTPAGAVIFEGLLEGKASFALGSGLEVLAGRPDVVIAQVGTGRGEPLGPIERVIWHRFGSDGRRLPLERP